MLGYIKRIFIHFHYTYLPTSLHLLQSEFSYFNYWVLRENHIFDYQERLYDRKQTLRQNEGKMKIC